MIPKSVALLGAALAFAGSAQAQESEPVTQRTEKHPAHQTLGEMNPESCKGLWGLYVVNDSDHWVRLYWAETMASGGQYLGPLAPKDSGIAYFRDPRNDLPQVWVEYQGDRLYVDGKNDISGYRIRAILGCDPRFKKDDG